MRKKLSEHTFRSTIWLFFILMSVIVVFSCKKEAELPAITDEDAVDLVSNSIVSETFGLASHLEQSVKLAEPWLLPASCGNFFDTIFEKKYDGIAVTFDYVYNWNWIINCSGGIVYSVDTYYYCADGQNSTSVLSSVFSTDGSVVITGIPTTNTDYFFNGTFIQSGEMTSKLREEITFTYDLSVTVNNITMNKFSYMTSGGAANFVLSCNTSDNRQFSFSGTVNFDGNGQCSLLLNGKMYAFQI